MAMYFDFEVNILKKLQYYLIDALPSVIRLLIQL